MAEPKKVNKKLERRWQATLDRKYQQDRFYCPHHCTQFSVWSVMVYDALKKLWVSRGSICPHAYTLEEFRRLSVETPLFYEDDDPLRPRP